MTLEDTDEAVLSAFERPESAERAALIEFAVAHGWNVSEYRLSEGALIRTLVRVGAESLQERALEIGYAQLAASLAKDERAEARELRRKRAQRARDEESA